MPSRCELVTLIIASSISIGKISGFQISPPQKYLRVVPAISSSKTNIQNAHHVVQTSIKVSTESNYPDLDITSSTTPSHGIKTNTQHDHDTFDIVEIDMMDAFTKSNFASTGCWGKTPLLMRGAFHTMSNNFDNVVGYGKNAGRGDIASTTSATTTTMTTTTAAHNVTNEHLWPTWNELIDISLEDDVEARFITHVPWNPMSWRMTLGPFEEFEVAQFLRPSSSVLLNGTDNSGEEDNNNDDEYYDDSLLSENEKWTMVINDVDRFHPSLFEFISDYFSFIPQWRRDDGQISISNAGGGIGPHTDDYDVFLIQMSGTRKWDIGKRLIPPKEELKGLYDELDVRILSFWEEEINENLVESFILQPGDVMYLPPRVAHCGTALSDGCMTLSVGLRAPSAKEMMLKLTEHVENKVDGDFVKRYTDIDLFSNEKSSSSGQNTLNEISPDVRTKAKSLLKQALVGLLEDDIFFDSFFGKIATETKRARSNYPLPLEELDDDDLKSLGPFGDPVACVNTFFDGQATLFSAEGVSWSYSTSTSNETNQNLCRLFVDGKMFEVEISNHSLSGRLRIAELIKMIAIENQLKSEMFIENGKIIPKEIELLLCDLVAKGYLYGSEV